MVLTGRYNSTMQINGIAHVQLTVSDFDAALPFYERLLVALGLTPVMRSEGFFYCVGGRTGVAISRAAAERRGVGSQTKSSDALRSGCQASLRRDRAGARAGHLGNGRGSPPAQR